MFIFLLNHTTLHRTPFIKQTYLIQVLLLIYKIIIPSQTVISKFLPNLCQRGSEKPRLAVYLCVFCHANDQYSTVSSETMKQYKQ